MTDTATKIRNPIYTTRWYSIRLRRDRLVRLTGDLYRAVSEVTGARLIVDSSKLPAYAALLRHADIDLRCAYVVRDPRGVAHLWAKTVTRPELVDGTSEMPRYGAARSALWWTAFDVAFLVLARAGTPTVTLRYEDFVADPRACVARTLDFVGLPTQDTGLDHITAKRVTLEQGHLVAGIPMRFQTGAWTWWKTAIGRWSTGQ